MNVPLNALTPGSLSNRRENWELKLKAVEKLFICCRAKLQAFGSILIKKSAMPKPGCQNLYKNLLLLFYVF
jgi:hypothetical protein